MANNWTSEQKDAIKTRGCNLLVAAAAGAGKTAVLVERIINMITDRENSVDIDRLLVVTFTNAAAAEMRERIGNAIARELFKNPESQLLQSQLVLLNKAKITTIHSFCLDVIKNYFHNIDLDPKFRIADETEVVLLKNETIEEIFEKKYQEKYNEDFLSLVESYSSNRDDSNIMDIVLSLYNFAKSSPFPEEWLRQSGEFFNIKEDFHFENSVWAKSILSSSIIELLGIKNMVNKAAVIVREEDSLQVYRQTYEEDSVMIYNLIDKSTKSWNDFVEGLRKIKFSSLKRCGKDVDKNKKEKVQKIRDKYKKQIKDIQEEVLNAIGEDVLENIKNIYPIMKCLVELVIEFDREYINKKRSRGIIDFNDFEHLALDILTEKSENGDIVPSKSAMELREKYEEIFIDEYQDSNLVQEFILSIISKKQSEKPNMFMVGDVKQSIYRFRQAKPELFLDKYTNYSSEQGARNRKILLFKNFRSRNTVLEGVNYIFKAIMSENIGELNYDDKEELRVGADFKEVNRDKFNELGVNEIHIIEKEEKGHNFNEEFIPMEDQEENIDNIRLEARLAALRIKELIHSKDKAYAVFDKALNEYRSIQYKDIVILLRATTNWSPSFVEELKNFDIPVFSDTGTSYFETTEIKIILSLLQIIDNPLQDIPLISVLRSPIASFTDEDLIDIKLINKSRQFYDIMKIVADKYKNRYTNSEDVHIEEGLSKHNFNKGTQGIGNDSKYIEELVKIDEENNVIVSLAKKCYEFMKNLKKFRDLSLHMPIDEFIWYLYTETGYYSYVGAMPSGVQRQANLRILFQRAKSYENTSYKGLFNFINFINKLKISSKDMGSAKILGENENVVRIMSIHKSKGLEFPVVILCAAGKNFNLRDTTNHILFHHELGIGPDYVDFKRRISYPTVFKNAIKKKIKFETLSEEMRILYVALTRAKEKLIIMGAVKDIKTASENWSEDIDSSQQKISENIIMKSKNYLDWIGSAVIRHESGEILRKQAEIFVKDNNNIYNDSKWEIKLWTREKIISEKSESCEENNINSDNHIDHIKIDKSKIIQNILSEIEDRPPRTNYYNEISKRLNWEYKYDLSKNIPSSISVTELKMQQNSHGEYYRNLFPSVLKKRPVFLENKKELTSAEKGTAMHMVMQRIDFNLPVTKESISKQVHKMISKEFITDKQADSIDILKIEKFFQSNLGKRMMSAEIIRREIPFVMELKASEIYKDLAKGNYENEIILLQGAIDCYFEEDGELVIVDYKTDYVTDENIEFVINKYRSQIKYYTEALQKITAKKVKEQYLYLFYDGRIVKI